MIALKLIFQSLAGLGSVLVCAGGGYYVMKEGNEENFYLVSSDSGIASSDTPSLELWTEQKTSVKAAAAILAVQTPTKDTKTQKNYKCESTEVSKKEVDEECVLYSLTTTTSTAIKMSDVQDFIKDTSATQTVVKKTETKATITANKLFLLKAEKKLHKALIFDGSKTITLRTKDSEALTTNKTYATFKVHAKVTSTEVTGTTNWIIAKAKAAPVSSTATPTITSATYTCKFKDETTLNACSLTALTSYSETTAFNFSSLTITSPQTTTLATEKDKYYLIKFVNTKPFNFSNTNKKEITFIDTQPSNTVKTTTLIFEAALFAYPTNTQTTLTDAILIK